MCISLKFTFLCIEKKSFPGKCFLVRSFAVRRKMFSVPGSRCFTSFLWDMFITRQFPCIFCHLQPKRGESRCKTSEFIWKIHFLCRKTSSHANPARSRLQSFITISISFLIASTREIPLFPFPRTSLSDRLICDLIRLLLCQFIFVTSSSMAPLKEESKRRVDKRRDEILIKKMGRKSLFAVSGLFHPGLISIAGGVT